MGAQRGWRPLLLRSAAGNPAQEEAPKELRKRPTRGRFGGDDEEALEGKGAPGGT